MAPSVHIILKHQIVLHLVGVLESLLDGYCKVARLKARVKLNRHVLVELLAGPLINYSFVVPADDILYVDHVALQVILQMTVDYLRLDP